MKPIVIITIVFVFLFVPTSVFAEHEYDDYDPNDPALEGKTPIRYYLIYASYYRDCNSFDSDKIQYLKLVTNQYLRMMNFLPITSNPHECVKVTGSYDHSEKVTHGLTLYDAVKKAEDWHPDLLIIVLDPTLRYLSLLETIMDGETPTRGHTGINYGDGKIGYIITKIALENMEGPEAAFVLTHELAHFGHYKLGYPRSISAGDSVVWNGEPKSYIHQMTDIYHDCQLLQFIPDYCSNAFALLKTHDSGYVKVIKPYDGPIPEPTCGIGTKLVNNVCQLISVDSETIPEPAPEPEPELEPTYDVSYKSNADIARESSWEQYQRTEILLTAKLNEANSYTFENKEAQNIQQKVRNTLNQEFNTLELLHEDLFDANRLMGTSSYEQAFHTYANVKIATADILDIISEVTPEIYRAKDLDKKEIVNEDFFVKYDYYFELSQKIGDTKNLYSMILPLDFKNKHAQNLIDIVKPQFNDAQQIRDTESDPLIDAISFHINGESTTASYIVEEDFKRLQKLDDKLIAMSSNIEKAQYLEMEVQKYDNIPDWTNNIIEWYISDELTEKELAQAMKYLNP